MKILLNLFVFFFSLTIMDNKTFSLNDFQIKKICKKEKRQSSCIKELKQKKMNLEKGNQIEIPVIPYKNKR